MMIFDDLVKLSAYVFQSCCNLIERFCNSIYICHGFTSLVSGISGREVEPIALQYQLAICI